MKREKGIICSVFGVKRALVEDLARYIYYPEYGGRFRLGNVCVLGDSL
jgi:hypothetical protein